jgi:ZIP family zinc transporter
MIIIVASFFLFSLIEKLFATHEIHDDKHGHSHIMGPIGASSMILHSFLDGAAIALAFQVDIAAGIIVALAVIMHDMTDGINTVVLMLKNKHSVRKACAFLVGDALAPVVGLIVTSLFVFPQNWLVYILAFFVGEFIYIGAATLLPETRGHPSRKLVIAMALGMILITILTGLIVG